MKRFYTHICAGDDCARDLEGTVLPDLETACRQAREEARFLVADEIQKGANEVEFDLRIEDETGAPLAALPICAKVMGLS